MQQTEILTEILFFRQPLQTMAKLMTETWVSQPAARLKALKVQKTLNKLKKSMEFPSSNI